MEDRLMASDLIKALAANMRGGDFEIGVWDADTDTQYPISSVTFEEVSGNYPDDHQVVAATLFINVNETAEAARAQDGLEWAIPVPPEPKGLPLSIEPDGDQFIVADEDGYTVAMCETRESAEHWLAAYNYLANKEGVWRVVFNHSFGQMERIHWYETVATDEREDVEAVMRDAAEAWNRVTRPPSWDRAYVMEVRRATTNDTDEMAAMAVVQ